MAEDYGHRHDRYRDEYDDGAENYDDGHDDAERYLERYLEQYLYAAGYGGDDYVFDWGDESVDDERFLAEAMDEPVKDVLDHPAVNESAANYDEEIWTAEEFGDDKRFLTGAVDEPVNDLLDEPAVGESTGYARIRRLKGSQRGGAWARRQGDWIPPDLRRFGSPVFWLVEDPHAQGPSRRMAIDPSEIMWDVLRQVLMTPLVNLPELARARGLDEDVVKGAVQALQKEGLLRSLSFGCLMPRTARYWVELVNDATTAWSDLEQAVVTWHRDGGVGSLLKYDLPRVESINRVAVQYAVDGWELEGVAWLEQDAVQAVALYNRRESPEVKSLVYFVWVSRWDKEQEVWERLRDLPEAVSPITQPSFPGSVVLVGDDRWAVARALPMAVESLRASGVEPAHIAAWTYTAGWQAASGASMLDGADQPFTPTLAPIQPDRFVWPRSRRSLGRTRLETIIAACPWTRRDSCTLYQFFILVAEYPGGSNAHYAALRGKGEKDGSAWRSIGILVVLGLVREAGVAGVLNLPERDRSELFSERGQGGMRLRLSLSPKTEKMLADLAGMLALGQAGESTEELAKKVEELGDLAKLAKLAVGQAGESMEDHSPPTANGAYRLMLNHGHLTYRELVRRSALARLADRLGDRRGHDDILVDILGCSCLLGCEVVPTSRAITVNLDGHRIESDAVIYCSSPAGNGHHRLELELSHLGPTEIRARLKKYALSSSPIPCSLSAGPTWAPGIMTRSGRSWGSPLWPPLSPASAKRVSPAPPGFIMGRRCRYLQ